MSATVCPTRNGNCFTCINRALVPWSIMPALPFLFEHKSAAAPGEQVIRVLPPYAPASDVGAATLDARALVAYLLALKHDYPAPPSTPSPSHKAASTRCSRSDQYANDSWPCSPAWLSAACAAAMFRLASQPIKRRFAIAISSDRHAT